MKRLLLYLLLAGTALGAGSPSFGPGGGWVGGNFTSGTFQGTFTGAMTGTTSHATTSGSAVISGSAAVTGSAVTSGQLGGVAASNYMQKSGANVMTGSYDFSGGTVTLPSGITLTQPQITGGLWTSGTATGITVTSGTIPASAITTGTTNANLTLTGSAAYTGGTTAGAFYPLTLIGTGSASGAASLMALASGTGATPMRMYFLGPENNQGDQDNTDIAITMNLSWVTGTGWVLDNSGRNGSVFQLEHNWKSSGSIRYDEINWGIIDADQSANASYPHRFMNFVHRTDNINIGAAYHYFPIIMDTGTNLDIQESPGVAARFSGGSTDHVDLSLQNTISSRGVRIKMDGAGGSDPKFWLFTDAQTGGSNNFTIYDAKNGQRRIHINNAGYISNGSLTPTVQLDITGTGKFTKVISTTLDSSNTIDAGALTTGTLALGSVTISGNLPVANLNSGTGATSSTFWRGDGTWAAVTGFIPTTSGTGVNLGFSGTNTGTLFFTGTDGSTPIYAVGATNTGIYSPAGTGADLGFKVQGSRRFYTNTSFGGIFDGDIIPTTTTSQSVGRSGNRWNNIFGVNLNLTGTLTISGTSAAPSNTASPAAWADVYISGTQFKIGLYQ